MLNFIINQIFAFLSWVISLFPTGTGFPDGLHTASSALGGYLHILDPLVPVSILLTCVTLIFSVEIALFGFRTFKWILSHVPIIGGKGN